jgi:hypothetical protein
MTDAAAKLLRGLVGAWRFELQTSCAQGRRATRLRYAPTFLRSYSTVTYEYVDIGDPSHCAKTVPECNRFRKHWTLFLEQTSV